MTLNPGAAIPGIPPNMSVLAAMSAGLLPANAQTTNFGITSAAGAGTGNGGRTILEAMSKGGEMGTGNTPGGSALLETFNSDSNGCAGPGGGQANQTEGPSSGQATQLPTTAPASAITIAATPVYGGA